MGPRRCQTHLRAALPESMPVRLQDAWKVRLRNKARQATQRRQQRGQQPNLASDETSNVQSMSTSRPLDSSRAQQGAPAQPSDQEAQSARVRFTQIVSLGPRKHRALHVLSALPCNLHGSGKIISSVCCKILISWIIISLM